MADSGTSRRIVVVHGAAGHRLVEALRSVGLEPIATVGEVTTWGPQPAAAVEAEVVNETAPVALAVSFDEAAQRLGVSRSSIYRLVEAGELHTVHLGRSARIPVTALEQLIERRSGQTHLAASS